MSISFATQEASNATTLLSDAPGNRDVRESKWNTRTQKPKPSFKSDVQTPISISPTASFEIPPGLLDQDSFQLSADTSTFSAPLYSRIEFLEASLKEKSNQLFHLKITTSKEQEKLKTLLHEQATLNVTLNDRLSMYHLNSLF